MIDRRKRYKTSKARVSSPSSGKLFGCILADPPWQYANFSDAKNGAASSAIVTEKTTRMGAIPVSKWAKKKCVLALWTTFPKLEEAFSLAQDWGFREYVTGFPWVKTVPSTKNIARGIGFWTQAAAELMLIFRNGKPKRDPKYPPQLGLMAGETFWSPPEKRLHSSKPIGIHEYLEALPGPHLELYARSEQPIEEGRLPWDCWGYDLGYELGDFGARRCEIPVMQTARDKSKTNDQTFLFGE